MKDKFRNISITRYVDDVIILCRHKELKNVFEYFTQLITEEYSLAINTKKVKSGWLREADFDFLGYRFYAVNAGTEKKKILISVRPSSVKKLQERLLRIMIQSKKDAKNDADLNLKRLFFQLNLVISGSVVEKQIRIELDSGVGDTVKYYKRYGWLFFFSQITDYSILYGLDSFVHKKLRHIFKDLDEKKFTEVHSFVKTLRDIRYNTLESNYIFHPYKYDIDQKREFLDEIVNIPNVSTMDDDTVDKTFKARAFKIIKKNERDLINQLS